MARTTPAAVKLVLAGGKDYDTLNNPDLTPYIDAASSMVDDLDECADDRDFNLSATKLEIIERWLAAHAYAMSDQPYTNRSTLGAAGTFQGQTAMNLDATKYGQMAKSLDPSGCLAGAGNVATILWGGLRPSEQRDYVDRD